MQNGKPPLPQIVDSTMINIFRSCHQKFHLAHHLGYRPKGVSIDLHAGACFAGALHEVRTQVYGNNLSLADALIMAHARFMQEWGDVEPPAWKPIKNRDRVWRAVEDYFTYYAPHTDHVQPLRNVHGKPTLEYTFALPLEPISETLEGGGFPLHTSGDPFTYAGKFDLLGELMSRPVICDEKTTSGIGPKWADQWNLRSQFIGYTWACQQCEIDVDTAVIRGIAILTNETKIAEAIHPYSNFIIERWKEQLRRDLWHIIQCHRDNYWDFDLGEACTAYGNCAFMDVCGSPNAASWLTDFEIRHWNPLSHTPAETPESVAAATHTR